MTPTSFSLRPPRRSWLRAWALLLATALLLALLPRLSRAQAPPAFCTATNTDEGTFVFTTAFQNTSTLTAGSAHFWRINVVAGETYSFSNCVGGSGDTYLRIYNSVGTLVAGNDDNGPYCGGTTASFNWVVPTGQGGLYFVHFAQYSCGSLISPTSLAYKATLATVTGPPTISSFAPTSGTPGTSVTLTGTNLTSLTGVSFNGTAATVFSTGTGTSATATVPAGATTGVIRAISAQGSGSSASNFTVLAAPTFSGFSPGSGAVGSTVTITGTGLDAITGVLLGGVTVPFALVSGSGNTQLTATVSSGANSGPITLVYGGGTLVSGSSFTVLLPDVNRVEYFLDSDPGLGSATAITITAGTDLANLAFGVNIGGLSTGFHGVGFRSRDSNGQWSLTTRRTFYYESTTTTTLADINRVEYFLDTDPGFGLATNVAITTGPDVNGLAIPVNISALTTGFHTLGFRSRDSNGQWSLTNRRTFYYETALNTPLANIDRVEYFLDSDPGLGNATAVTGIAALTDVNGVAFAVDLTAVGTGFHSLGIRSRDANGAWSLTNRRTFYYEPIIITLDRNITRIEYFLDTDPGFGLATDVTPTAGNAFDYQGVAFGVNVSSLTPGFHTLNVRSKDDQNKWSLTNRRTFYYEPLTTAIKPDITRIEYYFDTDPGFGIANNVPITAGPDLAGVGVLADASALADGVHTLYIRSRDANGKWSLVSNRPFLKNGCGSSTNVAAGLPAGNYSQFNSYNGSASNAFNNPAGSSNNFYAGAAGLMQADFGVGNLQSISEVRLQILPTNSVSNLTIYIRTSLDGNNFTTVDTYTFAATGNTPYDIIRTLPTVASNVRALRLEFGPAPSFYVTGVGAYFFNCNGPAITAFTPTGGAGGTTVNITGTNLAGVTSVSFNGTAVPLAQITNNTATGLTVVAPASGTSGQICLTATAGSTCSAQSYQYPPTIATGTVSPQAFCARTAITVPFTTNLSGYSNGNQFAFQLSDASGVFTNTSRLYNQNVSASGSGGYVSDTIDIHTPAATGYRVRVVSSNPLIYGTPNPVNLTVYPTPVATATATPATVTYNGSTTLTAGPAGQGSYTWYVRYTNNGGVYYVGAGASLALNNLQVSQSGKYFVYVQNGSGCQDSASVNVLVQPSAQPILAIAQFGGGFCAGSSQLSFSFAVQGNALPNGSTVTAQLSDAGGSFASPVVIGTVPFAGQGTGYFNVTMPAGTAAGTGYRVRLLASSAFVATPADNGSNLTINALPVAIANSNSPVAYGGTIQLTAQSAGAGAGYQWYGPNFYSTLQNPTIANATTASNQGTYQLVVTQGGCQNSATTTVVVSPSSAPILTMSQFGGGPFCAGTTTLNVGFNVTGNSFASGNQIQAQLSDASGSFGASVLVGSVGFAGQGNASVSVSIPAGTPTGTGYRIRLVGTNPGVPSQTDNGANLSINAAPVAAIVANNSPVAYSGTVTLTAQAVPGATYVWSVPGVGNVSTGASPTFSLTNATPANSGTYTLTVLANSCSASTTASVNVLPAGQPIVAIGQFGATVCAGASLNIGFSVTGANLNGTLTAQLSDDNGSFAAPVAIGSTAFNGQGGGSIAVVIPVNTPQGGLYRIRLLASVAAAYSPIDNGTNISISATPVALASSNSPVSAGVTIQLTAATTLPGTVYSWTGPNGFSAPNQQNPTINNATATNAGTYVLTTTLSGCSTQSTVQVSVGAASFVLATGPVNGSFCPGGAIAVPYSVTTGSVNGGNTFSVQLSNASGSFASAVVIGFLSSSAANGTISAQIPVGTPAGSGYRVRVVANSPAAVGSDNGTDLTVGALTYTWTGGNGNTNWFDPLNWSCGQVPGSTSVVIIPGSLTFYPVITGATAALALNLTIQTGAYFTNNGTFNLYGNVTVNSVNVSASSTSTWSFVGGITQYLYGSSPFYVGNVVIGSGTTFTMNNALYVSNYWTNNGTYVGGSSYNVYFNGTGGLQLIGGSSVSSFYNVYVNSGAVVNLGINAVFLNNFVVNGTFGAVNYGVVFGGTVGQTIGGTGTSTYYNVTINNLVGVSLVSNITVLGDWINNGLFSGGTYSVIFGGTVAQIIGGTAVTNFYNVNFQNPISVTLHQNIYVLGGFVNTGIFYGWYLNGGVTTGYFVRFGGTTAQVITANATTYFYHFYVDNTSGVSLATNIYIAGNYYLYSGSFTPSTYTVYFNGNEGPTVVQTVGGYTNLSFYGWNIGAGSYVRLIQNVTWLGSFANAGTFYGYNLVSGVYTGYTAVFGGSVAQVIGGTGVYEFWHVTWNNLLGITLNQNISVWGNWLNNGGYFANGYLVNFIGNVAQLIGGSVNTIFHHVTITNTVSVSLSQAITVLGNWAGSGVFLGNGYLTYFNGTAAQTIFCGLNTRFFDLRFNNPVSITLLSNIYLLGNWTHDGGFFANGFTVFFGGSATQFIAGTVQTIFHHVNIVSGATVQINRNITLLGNWLNNGSFLANNLLVYFNGTVAQLIGGTAVTNFYNVTFNNAISVTLNQNIYVLGQFINSGVFYGYQGLTGYFVRFGGTVAQTVTANATTFFYHFYADNAAGVILSSNVYIAGNYYLYSGLFTPGSYTVYFNGTGGYVQTVGGYTGLSFYGWNIGSGSFVRLIQNVTLLGNFANAGNFYGYNLVAGVYTGYTCAFGGTVAQSLTGAGVYDFWHLTWNNLAGVTLNRNISLRGNWLHYGGFLANGYLVTFGGSALQFIGGTVATIFHHFTIATGATVRQDLGITLIGDWTNNGLFNPNGLLTYFNGTVLQTIAGTALTTFYDVTFNNAVNVSLGQNIDVTRNFINSGGYCGCGFRTRFNGTAAQSITCTSGRTHFHDLTFDNPTGVTLLDGIYVSGLWVNNGGYIANNQTVIFDGTVLQSIGGSVLTAFYNIGITNTVDVQLLRDISVGGFWNNTGIFHGNGFGTTFNGLALQTITTTSTLARSYFHHITWANLVGCVLGGDIYVAGNWLCNGPFNPATWTVYFNGTLAQTCGGSQQIRFFGLNCSNPAGVTYNGPVYLLGNFVNTGLVNCGLYGWYCTGTAPQTIGGISTTPTRFYDLFIQNATGVTATDNWFVTHVLTPTTGNLASNGHLTLTSNATGTAMVVNPVGGGVVTGVSTMERFITGLSGAPGYRHYSSPMKLSAGSISTTVQEFADDLPVFELNPAYNTVGNSATPFPTVFKYDETRLTASLPTFDQGWMVPTATEDLLPLRGYTAQTSPTTTVDISGELNTGSVSYSLGRGSLANSGWHLLGNPYPAPMDWDVVRATTGMLTGVADALYVFQPSGQYTGTYKAYVNGLGQNGGTKDLAAMQGFFVRATAPTAAVSLTNAVRATSYLSPIFERQGTNPAQQPVTSTSSPKPVLRLEARNVASGTADETVIYFEAAAGLGFSPQHDAYKMQLNGNGRPSLWSQAGTDGFAINGLPALATAPVIPLGVRVSVDGNHELALTGLTDVPAGTQVWLEDRVLNRRQNLAANATYAFSMLANYTGSRFYLNFVAASPLAVTTGKLEARTALYPNPTTGRTTLELAGLREQGAVKVDVVNVLGQSVQTLNVRPKLGFFSETLDLSGLPSGVYTVRIHAQEGTVVKRLVKE